MRNGQRIWINIFQKKTDTWPTGIRKRCWTPLVIWEMQTKATMRYHLTSFRMAIIKETGDKCQWGLEKGEPMYTVGGNVNWCSYYGKLYGGSSNNKNRSTMWSRNSTAGYLAKGNKSINLPKKTALPCLLQHYLNSQDMETV